VLAFFSWIPVKWMVLDRDGSVEPNLLKLLNALMDGDYALFIDASGIALHGDHILELD
jgi:hypothetical protein